jgi:hypothetical protein
MGRQQMLPARRKESGSADKKGATAMTYDATPWWKKYCTKQNVQAPLLSFFLVLMSTVDFYQEEKEPVAPMNKDGTADDALLEQFTRDYLESIEQRSLRKPAAPPTAKGAKDQPKGPKLGGSRNARAAMRQQEDQAAKKR